MIKLDINPSSIIPSDYCYNRVNNGIDPIQKPVLFKYRGHNQYLCLGTDNPYNGDVYHKPKSSNSGYVCGARESGIHRKQ